MEELNNNELREYIKERNNEFSYESFLGISSKYPDYGATAVITAEQAVTMINGEDGRDNHYYIQRQICKAIHDLRGGTDASDVIWQEYKRRMDQTIRFTIMNEGETMPRKMIWIVFPEEITLGHLKQLRAYQEKFGSQVNKASKDYGKKIVGFMNMKTGQREKGEDFEEAIRYAETLPISRENVGKDKFIIGDSATRGKTERDEEDELEI